MVKSTHPALRASDGQAIDAFDVEADGALTNFRKFAVLQGGTADSICMDNDGRLYVAGSADGVQVFSPKGDNLGAIPTALRSQAVAFAGTRKETLYIVGAGAVYKVAMIARGIRNRAK